MLKKSAFTLIEVMVSVMILSVVIVAMLNLSQTNGHNFSNLQKNLNAVDYSSTLAFNYDYGFEKEETTMFNILSDFDVDSKLREKIKDLKIELSYREVMSIDPSGESDDKDDEDNNEEKSNPDIFEIGKTTLRVGESSASFLRLRVQ